MVEQLRICQSRINRFQLTVQAYKGVDTVVIFEFESELVCNGKPEAAKAYVLALVVLSADVVAMCRG